MGPSGAMVGGGYRIVNIFRLRIFAVVGGGSRRGGVGVSGQRSVGILLYKLEYASSVQ
jgi:hypothetical protein